MWLLMSFLLGHEWVHSLARVGETLMDGGPPRVSRPEVWGVSTCWSCSGSHSSMQSQTLSPEVGWTEPAQEGARDIGHESTACTGHFPGKVRTW